MFGLSLASRKLDEESEESSSAGAGLARRAPWMELLLRRGGSSIVSSYRLLAKKELFDAVMGVVGVFGSVRDAGGLRARCDEVWLPTLDVAGKFKGPMLRGGSRSGSSCRFDFVVFSSSVAIAEAYELFLTADLCGPFMGSGSTGMEMLPVELLWMLVESTAFRLVFFFSIK